MKNLSNIITIDIQLICANPFPKVFPHGPECDLNFNELTYAFIDPTIRWTDLNLLTSVWYKQDHGQTWCLSCHIWTPWCQDWHLKVTMHWVKLEFVVQGCSYTLRLLSLPFQSIGLHCLGIATSLVTNDVFQWIVEGMFNFC